MTFISFHIEKLDISPQHIAACTRAGLFNALDVLLPSAIELSKKLKYPRIEQVHQLVKSVSRAIVPSPIDFGHLQFEYDPDASVVEGECIRTGDAGLDTALGGGLRVGTITEIAGESASGKSHFCLLLAVSAQLASLSTNPGAVMILTSEREIATDRMMEIAYHMSVAHSPDLPIRTKDLLDNVLSNIVSDVTALDHTLTYKVPHILRERLGHGPSPIMGQHAEVAEYHGGQRKPIRLLIVDSITALIRGADSDYNTKSTGLAERSRHLCSVSDKLKAIALEFGLAVLVINQVTDVFSREPIVPSGTPMGPSPSPSLSQFYTEGNDPPMVYSTQARWFSGQTDTLKKEASLGIVWANAVNTRIMLSRTGRRRIVDQKDLSRRPKRKGTGTDLEGVHAIVDDVSPTLIRRLHVVFSPFAPTATIDYIISPTGIHSLPNSYRKVDIAETLRRRRKLKKAILGGDKEEQPYSQMADNDQRDGSQTGNAEDDQQSGLANGRDGHGDDDDDIYDEFGDIPTEWWNGDDEALIPEPLALGGDV